MVRPFAKRNVVGRLMKAHQLSRSRSCDLSGLARSTTYYKPVKVDDSFVRDRLQELASLTGVMDIYGFITFFGRKGWSKTRSELTGCTGKKGFRSTNVKAANGLKGSGFR